MRPPVSIIIPVYNTEQYIERCARSLFEQTLDNIEYIFVDDCSTDNSVAVLNRTLAEYPHRAGHAFIISHTHNRGVAAARQTGLDQVSGEYTIHCDSDDWVTPDMYETLYRKAIVENADMVICAYYQSKSNKVFIDKNSVCDFEVQYPGTLPLDDSIYNGSLVNKLVRTSLYKENNIHFWEGLNMTEDLGAAIPLRIVSQKTVAIATPLYYYDTGSSSSVSRFKSRGKIEQQVHIAKKIADFVKSRNLTSEFGRILNAIKLSSKHELILTYYYPAEWRTVYPMSVKDIWRARHVKWYFRIIYILTALRLDFAVKGILYLKNKLR